jgi:hypothetical protein
VRTSSSITLALFALLVSSSLSSVARGDAIDPAPACPPGAQGASSHAGHWCVPWPCTSDAECRGGACRRWRVCTRVSDVPIGGLRMFRPGEPTSHEETLVVGTCDPSRACTGTEEPPPPTAGTLREGAPSCTEATYCVPAELPELPGASATTTAPARPRTPRPSPSSSGGCNVARRTSGAGAIGILLAAIAVLVLARRRA